MQGYDLFLSKNVQAPVLSPQIKSSSVCPFNTPDEVAPITV